VVSPELTVSFLQGAAGGVDLDVDFRLGRLKPRDRGLKGLRGEGIGQPPVERVKDDVELSIRPTPSSTSSTPSPRRSASSPAKRPGDGHGPAGRPARAWSILHQRCTTHGGSDMARPPDWSDLDLDEDPVPDDPYDVKDLAKTLGDLADDVGTALRSVRGLGGDTALLDWVGMSGDAFRE
jgi:hypothetical protein